MPGPKGNKPFYRRTWVIVTAAIVALLLIVGIASGGSKKKAATVTAPVTTIASSPSATAPTPATTPASGGGSTSSARFARFTPNQAIAAFKKAGLDVGASRPMTKDDYGLAPLVATAGIRFFIASLGPDSGGRVMSFANQGDLDHTKAYYDEFGKQTAALFSWTFANENLLVQINGDLPEANARAYEAALKSLSGSSTS